MSSIVQRSTRTPSRSPLFKLAPVAVGCAVLIMTSSAAFAQAAAPDAGLSTVTVVGIRKGIEDAISVKKNADSIVEAISAEDIGKLPDTSIAESLARMPGVAAQRVDGRAQTIAFRGMSGDFAGTLLNGREQVSTGDNRGVEFDQYPSELLSGVVFYKTADAVLIGQGLSGTVDMQSVSPLAFGKRTIAVNVRGERNSMGSLNDGKSATGNRVSFSYIDQFADRTVGVALGFAHLDSPGQSETFEAWGYPTAPTGEYILGGSKQYAVSKANKRDGLMAVVEWKPSKDYSSKLDLFYSKFSENTTKRGLEAGTIWGPGTLQPASLAFDTTGFATQGTWVGARPVLVNRPELRDDTLQSVGWKNKLKAGNDWTLVGDLSYSKADRKETLAEFYAGAAPGVTDTLKLTQTGSGALPRFNWGLNYGDPATVRLVDAGGWGQDGYVKYPNITDELKSIRVDAKRSLSGAFSSLDVGLNYSERTKDKKTTEYQTYLKTSPTSIPAAFLTGPSSLSYVGIPSVIGFDGLGALASLYNLKQNTYWDIFEKNWNVTEKVTTGHAKLNLDTEMGSIPVRGNFGLQVIRADQSSTAIGVTQGDNSGAPSTQAVLSGGKNYTDLLPSVNLAFSLPNDQTLRLGAARVMARPRMDQMVASQHFSVDTTKREWSGGGGNPELDPWRANALDVSYEKYFGKQAYIGVAAYYKDLKSFIYDQTVAYNFTGRPNNTSVTPVSSMGNFKQPTNGIGGYVKGLEFTVSAPLKLVTPTLDGFGVMLSMSGNFSSIESNGPGSNEPLQGLSKNVANLTLYYEKNGFSTRISDRSRSKFLGEVSGFSAKRENVYVKAEDVIDFQIGYEFQSGTYKGLGLLFQVNNLTNARYETQFGEADNKLKVSNTYGSTMLFGLNYKM